MFCGLLRGTRTQWSNDWKNLRSTLSGATAIHGCESKRAQLALLSLGSLFITQPDARHLLSDPAEVTIHALLQAC